jgi:hypothetical protein
MRMAANPSYPAHPRSVAIHRDWWPATKAGHAHPCGFRVGTTHGCNPRFQTRRVAKMKVDELIGTALFRRSNPAGVLFSEPGHRHAGWRGWMRVPVNNSIFIMATLRNCRDMVAPPATFRAPAVIRGRCPGARNRADVGRARDPRIAAGCSRCRRPWPTVPWSLPGNRRSARRSRAG